ncbi:hypothetical protein EPUS_08816 [Endocarpon pusillum Z07020]|uniref:Uncharacterized protein n=1 Tax=Endocarpon pusillum (strain Z07020 / HMAS-L-300199) TaxID=1263415 RepID=U1GBD1_ENDPU|nr:uncharacterized protein EPUS_08816 [Endocarpon pusillum Z07020]ERF69343.1 hypothetical protein EPUS_08816 [Endocarpon pusillum Z07020]
MPVEKNDSITVPLDKLKNDAIVPLKWQQIFQDRNSDYYLVNYENKSKVTEEEHVGMLFIEKSKVEEFKGVVKDGQITVSEKFQYGQPNKAGNKRFLVYHNKDNKPYQHRFVDNMLTKYGSMGAEALEKMGMMKPNEMVDLISGLELTLNILSP